MSTPEIGNPPTGTVRYAEWIMRWRWLIVIAAIASVFIAINGAKKIRMQNNYKVFFSAENPQLKAFEDLQNIYTRDDNVMFVVSKPDGKVFSKEFLEAQAWLTDEVWKLPFVTRVDSIPNFQHSEAAEDDLLVGDLVEFPDELDEAALARVEKIAKAEPMIVNRLISDRVNVVGVNATLTLPYADPNEPVIAASSSQELADKFEAKFPGYEVYLTGIVMLNNAFATSSMGDMQSIVPMMYLGILITMILLLRSFTGTMVTLVVIILSSAAGMGFMGYIGFPLTPPVAIAPTIITTLAVADSIHVLVTMLHQMRKGQTKREAIIESMRMNFQPVLLTSLTTAIGFLSLNWSDAPPFRALGNIVAVGVGAAWIYSITLLPALMSILPVRVKQQQEDEDTRLDRFADFIIRNRQVSLWGSIAVIVILATFIPRIQLDDRWVDYFDESIKFRTDTDYAVENLTGIYSMEYSIEANESGGINNPEHLQKLDEFTAWFREQPEVRQVVTISDIMKRLNKNMHANDEAYYKVPDERELAAQYLLLFEMSLPYGLDLNNQINVDKSATRMMVLLGDISTTELRNFITKAAEWQAENLPEYMRAEAASPSTMFAYISQRNIESMLTGTALAVLLISLILGIALKSVRYGFISLIPNFVPAIMGFGAWGLLVSNIGMSLSVVTGMTLGIVVDDTVHFLSKYLRARRELNASAEDAVRYAFHNVGRALVVTTFILVVGFAILSTSPFRLNSWMGQLTAIVITFALLADFIMLPALLIAFDRDKGTKPTENKVIENEKSAAAAMA
jgi:uncharacterized protein